MASRNAVRRGPWPKATSLGIIHFKNRLEDCIRWTYIEYVAFAATRGRRFDDIRSWAGYSVVPSGGLNVPLTSSSVRSIGGGEMFHSINLNNRSPRLTPLFALSDRSTTEIPSYGRGICRSIRGEIRFGQSLAVSLHESSILGRVKGASWGSGSSDSGSSDSGSSG